MTRLPALRRHLLSQAAHSIRQNVSHKFYHQSCRMSAAHNFTMPAMSPTMTEGNIARWKVEEGQSFEAGDVLLEIETDKASMDIEAQDDGVVAKIMASEGTKGIKVGSRIAVLADPEDDISTISIPKDETTPMPKAKEQQEYSSSSSTPISDTDRQLPPKEKALTTKKPPGNPQKQKYPLYPSVVQLMHKHDIDLSEADSIPATGPSGRLLKGDILAYIGDIDTSAPSELSERLDKLSHLDLSNIKIAARKSNTEPSVSEQTKPSQLAPKAQITLTISFKAIREVQKRVHDALGIDIPLQTFLSRAIEISNTDLPPTKSKSPTADELFDDILGVRHLNDSASQGHFVPQIVAISPRTSAFPLRTKRAPDLIDVLSGVVPNTNTSSQLLTRPVDENTVSSIFTVIVAEPDERRARVFLERVKTILQVEPGRLVL